LILFVFIIDTFSESDVIWQKIQKVTGRFCQKSATLIIRVALKSRNLPVTFLGGQGGGALAPSLEEELDF